jgi:hypothetical protein
MIGVLKIVFIIIVILSVVIFIALIEVIFIFISAAAVAHDKTWSCHRINSEATMQEGLTAYFYGYD